MLQRVNQNWHEMGRVGPGCAGPQHHPWCGDTARRVLQFPLVSDLVARDPDQERIVPNKYGPKAAEKVEKAMHEMKRGKLRSSSGKKVTNPKQAIAIGLSQARKAGGKVPAKKK